MDLLNTILNSMEKPPITEQQKKLNKRQREMAEKMKNKQKEELLRFRKYVEERLGRFAKDDRPHIEFQPLDKVHRAVIHEVAEFGGFIAMSFGREDIDRYSVVYKKENAPTEDEISARRNGDGWNEEIAKEYAERKQQRELLRAASTSANHNNNNNNHINSNNNNTNTSHTTKSSSAPSGGDHHQKQTEVKPTSNYKDKYAHLIGQDAALEAARKTETNKSYGFVPSKNKKDIRSIEQTLADIKAKKRLKLQQQQEQEQQQSQTDDGEPMPQQAQTASQAQAPPPVPPAALTTALSSTTTIISSEPNATQ